MFKACLTLLLGVPQHKAVAILGYYSLLSLAFCCGSVTVHLPMVTLSVLFVCLSLDVRTSTFFLFLLSNTNFLLFSTYVLGTQAVFWSFSVTPSSHPFFFWFLTLLVHDTFNTTPEPHNLESGSFPSSYWSSTLHVCFHHPLSALHRYIFPFLQRLSIQSGAFLASRILRLISLPRRASFVIPLPRQQNRLSSYTSILPSPVFTLHLRNDPASRPCQINAQFEV